MSRKADTIFVIIFQGRTGSSFLVSLLNDHSKILCYPEILANSDEEDQKQIFKALKEGEPVEDIRNFASSELFFNTEITSKTNLHCVGFKAKHADIASPAYFEEFMGNNNGRVLHLARRNLIKSTLSVLTSRMLYQKHNQWNALSNDQTVGKVTVDIDEFKHILKGREYLSQHVRDYYTSLNLPKIEIWYEDLLIDRAAFMRNIFDFLGVEYQETQGTFAKNTPDNLQDAVENYDELYAAFANTKYEQYFHMD